MRIASESLAGRWPVLATRYQPSGLTERRFVDFGRTESMMCHFMTR
jgi:hypothetical protein